MWAEPRREAARRDSHTIKVGLCYVDADCLAAGAQRGRQYGGGKELLTALILLSLTCSLYRDSAHRDARTVLQIPCRQVGGANTAGVLQPAERICPGSGLM